MGFFNDLQNCIEFSFFLFFLVFDKKICPISQNLTRQRKKVEKMKKRWLVNSIWIPILSIWKENKLFSNHTAREVTNVLMHTSSKKVYQEDCNWCFKKFFFAFSTEMWKVLFVCKTFFFANLTQSEGPSHLM